jgi:ABC-type taurine transport system ATPase subunit
LEEKVATAEARKKHAQAAREHAETIANALTRQSSKFTAEALKPLSERITAFNQVISPFHFDFRIGARQTASRAARTERFVNLENPGTGKSKEHDPQARLSEGQISALGLSVLCGASTIYRWSRWPALLLDDPFQNADLIHTAAFIDVIRSMMRENGFQVIISTHDLQQADFLARKCCKANLPVTRFELLGLGKDGVRYKVN